jgi:hypothetical protein
MTIVWFQHMASYDTIGLRGNTDEKEAPQRMLDQGT